MKMLFLEADRSRKTYSVTSISLWREMRPSNLSIPSRHLRGETATPILRIVYAFMICSADFDAKLRH